MKNRTFEQFMFDWLKPFYPESEEHSIRFTAKARMKTLRKSYDRDKYKTLRVLFFLKRSNDMMFNAKHNSELVRSAIHYIKTGIIKDL